MLKTKKILAFTLIELMVVIGLLGMLISTFTYLGYDALKEFRRRNGQKAFKEYLITLTHKNALLENYVLVSVEQKGDFIETTVDGNIDGLNIKNKVKKFYVGKIFEENNLYSVGITAQAIPDDKDLWSWIKKDNYSYLFFDANTSI